MKGYQSFIKNLKSSYSFILKFRIFDLVIVVGLLNFAILMVIILYIQQIYTIKLPSTSTAFIDIQNIPELTSDGTPLNASAAAYVVYDPKTRTIVTGKNQNLRFSPASTAKIMSAIVALEYYDTQGVLEVPFNIYAVQGSKMHLVPGEKVKVLTLLYGMMLPSGNDAAYTLAFHYPGGPDGFVEAMNKKAKDLKLLNTHFLDSDGYDDGNFTTAKELARLGAFAMENSTFKKIVATRFIELANESNSHTFYLENLNELLKYENVEGVKTGFTNEAGGVLVTAVRKNENLFIVVVLKSQDRFSDTKDIMDFINSKVEFADFKN